MNNRTRPACSLCTVRPRLALSFTRVGLCIYVAALSQAKGCDARWKHHWCGVLQTGSKDLIKITVHPYVEQRRCQTFDISELNLGEANFLPVQSSWIKFLPSAPTLWVGSPTSFPAWVLSSALFCRHFENIHVPPAVQIYRVKCLENVLGISDLDCKLFIE